MSFAALPNTHAPALLLLLALASVPTLPAVQRAFSLRVRHQLFPGERVILIIRPDLRMMARWGLGLGAPIAAMLIGLRTAGIEATLALAFAAAPMALATAHLGSEMRKRWIITDRRLLTAAGASLPLCAITRLETGPGLLRVRAGQDRILTMMGLVDSNAMARLLQGLSTRQSA